MGKRIAVVGAGAVGGYVGGSLAHAGYDVTLIDPWPEHIEAIRAGGLQIAGVTAEEAITVTTAKTMHLTELQSLAKQPPIDIALVSVKSYDTDWATAMIAQYLSPQGFVGSLQNCMNEERIAGIVGWDRILGIIVATLSVELMGPARIQRTAPKTKEGYAAFRVGEVHGRVTPRAEELAEMIRSLDTAKVTQNLWGERWSKLCVNGMRNGVSAATGLGGNARDSDERIRRFCIRLGSQSVRVGQALGYELEHIGKLEPDLLARAGEGDARALDQVETILSAGNDKAVRSDMQRPSMAQDMAKGRRTEIDYMNGFIADKGAGVGVAAPAHSALADVVKRVERGEIPASPDNIYRLGNA